MEKDLRYFNRDEYRRRYHPLCGCRDRHQCKCQRVSGRDQDKATSLKLELGRSVKRSEVIQAVAESFEEYYAVYEKTCDMSGLQAAYNEMLANMDKEVCVLDPRGEYRGKALGIDEEGCLLVEKENGELIHVLSGEVSVRGIYGYV